VAVGEDIRNNFVGTRGTEKDPTGAGDDENFGRLDIVEDVEYDSAPTQRFEGYVHTSHLSMSELAHPTGSPIKERDIMPEKQDE
jgi:hypothetical protein